MKKCILLLTICLMLTVSLPVSARSAIGLSLDSAGIYPMGLLELENGYTIGAEAYPGLTYIGFIGRHYEHRNFLGTFGGLVIGSTYSSRGLNLLRLQGGYNFRLENNGRVSMGLSYDTVSNGYSSLGLIAELHYIF